MSPEGNKYPTETIEGVFAACDYVDDLPITMAAAQGFTYNIGRGLSAIAPFTIGALAKTYGLGIAFYLTAASFLFSALVAFALPETKGKELE